MKSQEMKCQEIFALLSQYIDLELPPDACAEIQAHIQDCAPCVDFTESLRKTVDLCRQYKPAELPAPLGAQAKEELRAVYERTRTQAANE